MAEQERDWLARSLCSDVSRKALWEARWGVTAEQVGNCILSFLDFTPTWIIRGQGEGALSGSLHLEGNLDVIC